MSAPRRICVIGNSSVGAVRVALGDRPPEGYVFSFFANGGPHFDRIGFSGDLVVGADAVSNGDPDLRTYDAFALHGRMPAAFEALRFARGLDSRRYSRQVQEAARRDWSANYRSWALGLELHARYGKPVLALSRNVFASECAGPEPERGEANKVMAGTLAPLRFVPLPEALFDAEGRVRREYFSRYVNVRGRESREATPDEWHYNRDAGALILAALLRSLDAAFA
jgi:hypothetical protein